MKQAFGVTAIPQKSATAAVKTGPFYPHVPRRFLDVKVLGVIASILQCKAFRYILWHWLFYLSPSVRRTAAASERLQPSILPSHCSVLNEQVLLNAIGQTSIFVPSPSLDSPQAWKVNWVRKEIWFLTSFLPCMKMLWVLSSIYPLRGKEMGSAEPCTGSLWLYWTAHVHGQTYLQLLPSLSLAVAGAQGLEGKLGRLRSSHVGLVPGTAEAIPWSREKALVFILLQV